MQASEDQLISEYAPLVRRQALATLARLPANVELDDLLQAGMMGLLDAVRRYEEQEGVRFETYAVTRIRGAILDELRAQDWLPRSVRSKSREVEAAIKTACQKLLRQPTEQEIAAEMGISLEEYQSVLQESQGAQILMYEDLVELSNNTEITNIIASDDTGNPLDLLAKQSLKGALVQAIKDLPEREQLLLSLQFEEDLNQKEIAAVMGVSEGRVSQLRSQAIARIRSWLKNNAWDTDQVKSSHIEILL